MSIMNRKMFNRNARNKLNAMGGVASFQTGGPTPTRNPNLYSRRFFINPKDTGADIQSSNMNYLQKIASQAKNQGIGSLSAIDQINLNMAMGQFQGSKMLPGLKRNLRDSAALPFIEAGTQAFGAFGPGTLGGITSVLLGGDPKDKGSFSGRLASARPSEEFLSTIGLDKLPTQSEILDEEAAVIGSPPGSIKPSMTKPPIAGGPTYQDPTLVDPTDPAVIKRIQSGIDVNQLMKGAVDGQGVRFNEKTGKYELDPNIPADPSIVEEERGIAGELTPGDVIKRGPSPGRLQAEFGSSIPKPTSDAEKKIIKPKDAPKVDPSVAEEERGIAGEITKDEIVEPKPKTKEEVQNIITTGSAEEQQSELKQLMSEFKQNAPKYEGMDKSLAISKIFFSIAAGKDPDAITNIAQGLEKGADMFIKDKAKKDEFNRQVDLASLRYGLQERSKDRKQKFFIADKDVTVDGKKFEKGSVVNLSEGYIRKNGIPPGLTTETLTKAAMDNAAAVKKALAKNAKDKKITNKDFIALGKQVTDATDTFTKSRNLQTLIQGQIFQVADGNVTGLAPAAQDIVNKAANAVGIDMGTEYESLERYNADMRKVANQLIKDLLGEGSKNISNVDRQLAQEIVGLFTTGSGGILGGYVFRDDDVLLSRLQGVHKTMQNTQQKSLAQIENILLATQGQTFQSGAPVQFAEIANLGIAGPGARASAQGQGQKTIKLSEFFQGGKFDKDKLNKLLVG